MKISRAIKKIIGIAILLLSLNIYSQSHNFKVILDAGHGGKDPGNSYHGFIEKEIALKTTLLVKKLLQKENDFQITLTRDTDEFIKLVDRPAIANKMDANLFVSIHCNSVKNPEPFGTETFVMGLARSETNMEMAKKENSVILLEKDYKETYKGFDPYNPETLIGLKILQEDYLYRSISLASKIEYNFTHKLNRKSRGIKQTPLWVLDAAYMPSVLIELGFLSNLEEGNYLNSEEGQNAMAKAIADAIISYKMEYFDEIATVNNESVVASTVETKTENNTIAPAKTSKTKPTQDSQKTALIVDSSKVIFEVQIAAGNKQLELKPSNFKGLKNVSLTAVNESLYRYTYGITTDFKEAQHNLEEAKAKGFTNAFIIATKKGQKITIQEALKQS